MSNLQSWYLEGFVGGEKRLRRLPIVTSPFRIGRLPGLELTLPAESVSSYHAEIVTADDRLAIRDLGSTNGTFVNRAPLEQSRQLEEGDVVHIAQFELRIGRRAAKIEPTLFNTTVRLDLDLPLDRVEQTLRLEEMIRQSAVSALFQPILSLADESLLGHELLGRGNLPGLPTQIGELFEIASYSGAELELTQLFRRPTCAGEYLSFPRRGMLFVNTHPDELAEPTLLDSIRELRSNMPEIQLVLEIHEKAATNSNAIRSLKEALSEMGVLIAYDDFGAGQSRLQELTEVPPAFVKFDRAMIADLDHATNPRRRLLESLVNVSRELGIRTIAEGIERRSEGEICGELGIDFVQGYFYGMPVPAPPAENPNSQDPIGQDPNR